MLAGHDLVHEPRAHQHIVDPAALWLQEHRHVVTAMCEASTASRDQGGSNSSSCCMVNAGHATGWQGPLQFATSGSSAHLVAEACAGVLVPHSELVVHLRVEVSPRVRVPVGT